MSQTVDKHDKPWEGAVSFWVWTSSFSQSYEQKYTICYFGLAFIYLLISPKKLSILHVFKSFAVIWFATFLWPLIYGKVI